MALSRTVLARDGKLAVLAHLPHHTHRVSARADVNAPGVVRAQPPAQREWGEWPARREFTWNRSVSLIHACTLQAENDAWTSVKSQPASSLRRGCRHCSPSSKVPRSVAQLTSLEPWLRGVGAAVRTRTSRRQFVAVRYGRGASGTGRRGRGASRYSAGRSPPRGRRTPRAPWPSGAVRLPPGALHKPASASALLKVCNPLGTACIYNYTYTWC